MKKIILYADNLSWDQTEGVDSYQIAILNKTLNPDSVISNTTPIFVINNKELTTIAINDLTVNDIPIANDNYYEFYIRGVNHCGNSATWSEPVAWGCFAPEPLDLQLIKVVVEVNITN